MEDDQLELEAVIWAQVNHQNRLAGGKERKRGELVALGLWSCQSL